MTLSVAGNFCGCGDSPNGHRRFVTRRLSSGDAGGVLHSKIGSILTSENGETQFHKHNSNCCWAQHDRDRRIFRWRHGSSKSQSPRVHPTSERGFVCGKVSDNITFAKKRKKARFSGCVGCFTTLFSVSGVSETEMVPSGAVDTSMIGCSTPYES